LKQAVSVLFFAVNSVASGYWQRSAAWGRTYTIPGTAKPLKPRPLRGRGLRAVRPPGGS